MTWRWFHGRLLYAGYFVLAIEHFFHPSAMNIMLGIVCLGFAWAVRFGPWFRSIS